MRNNYIISAFADEYDDSFDRQLAVLKEKGIEYIELRFADKINVADFTEDKLKEIKQKLDKEQIKVSSIGSPLGKISLDGDFDGHLLKAEKIFKSAVYLGCKFIRVFSFYMPEGRSAENCREEVIDKMGRLIELAEKYNVTLCHENEAKIYGESPENCLDLLETFKGKLKCVFDMGNFVLDGHPPFPKVYDMLKKHIAYFHIKDALKVGAIVPAGLGEARIEEILKTYKKEFDKPVFITLEPHLQTFGGLNALVGKSFDNPYKYKTQQAAFLDAIEKLKEIYERI